MFLADSPDSPLLFCTFFEFTRTGSPVGLQGAAGQSYMRFTQSLRHLKRVCRFRVNLWGSPRETAELYSNESVLSTVAIR
jgi:hypothetical protein